MGKLTIPWRSAAGTRYFPPLDEHIELQLLETRTFSSWVVYLRYSARARS